jgi:hypothetical protein
MSHQFLSYTSATSGGKRRNHAHLHEWKDSLHLNGYINKLPVLVKHQPHEMHEEPLHSDVVTVWCAVLLFRIMGPYCFEDDWNSVTVSAHCCVHKTDDIFTAQLAAHLEKHGVIRVQQLAKPHWYPWTLWNVWFLIVPSLGKGIFLSQSDSPVLWPAVSYCGVFKKASSAVHHQYLRNIMELKCRIREEAAQVPMNMLQHVMNNICSGLEKRVWRNWGCLQGVMCRTYHLWITN